MSSKYGIGQPVLRFEDPRLLRGQGKFINDVNIHGQAYAVFVRSPHAHAKINRIDVETANARVIDLTRRLTTMSQEVLDLRAQLSRGAVGRAGDHGVARDLFEARAEIAALRLQLGN